MEKYEKISTLYKTNEVEVLKCRNIQTNSLCCIKTLPVNSLDDMAYMTQEVMNLYSLKKYPYFVEFLEHFFMGKQKQVEKICIVTEFCEKGDLGRDLSLRQLHNNGYKEPDLLHHIQFLLAGFKKLQKSQIFHRDIKPENIFISNDGKLKIGDLGSSNIRNDPTQTIIGSPIYMSPEVRRNFQLFQSGNIGPRVNYDAARSDMWSLGLTFLFMISNTNVKEFMSSNRLEECVNQRLKNIVDPIYAEMLGKMLQVEPLKRPDFVEIEEWLKLEIEKKNKKKENIIEDIEREYSFLSIDDAPQDGEFLYSKLTSRNSLQLDFHENSKKGKRPSSPDQRIETRDQIIPILPSGYQSVGDEIFDREAKSRIQLPRQSQKLENKLTPLIHMGSPPLKSVPEIAPIKIHSKPSNALNEKQQIRHSQTYEEEKIPHISQIRSLPQKPSENCSFCNTPGKTIPCYNCNALVHLYCLGKLATSCGNCSSPYNYSLYNLPCERCNTFFNVTSVQLCNHQFCPDCQLFETTCNYCFQFELISPTGALKELVNLNCHFCFNPFQVHKTVYTCTFDKYAICSTCKSFTHPGSCISNDKSTECICYTCYNSASKPLKSYIYSCPTCNLYKCLVCGHALLETSHTNCVFLYTQPK